MKIYLITQSNFYFDNMVLGFFTERETAEEWMDKKIEELASKGYEVKGDNNSFIVHLNADAITYAITEVTEGVE